VTGGCSMGQALGCCCARVLQTTCQVHSCVQAMYVPRWHVCAGMDMGAR
jgi:hypothetical protein